MALPSEVPSEKVDAIGKEIDQMSADEIAALPTLLGSDFRLFGKITQCFCFIDLNLRRALEVFHLAGLLPEPYEKQYPKIRDFELTTALAAVVNKLDPAVEDIPTTLTWLQAIDKFRGFRNLAGHAAARGHPKADVYVFANKNTDDARRGGKSLPKHGFLISVVGRSEFFEMVDAAKMSEDWLGKKVPEWAKRYRETGGAAAKNEQANAPQSPLLVGRGATPSVVGTVGRLARARAAAGVEAGRRGGANELKRESDEE